MDEALDELTAWYSDLSACELDAERSLIRRELKSAQEWERELISRQLTVCEAELSARAHGTRTA